jgi:4'-phosphopantetheinyl transferase
MNGSVRVLLATAPDDAGSQAGLVRHLSPAERCRSAHMRGDRRAEFVTGRALARCALARLLGVAPAAVPIVVAPGGRPRLRDPRGPSFSIAHSRRRVALALSWRGEVGIDIEPIRPVAPRVVRRSCTADELEALGELLPDRRAEAFMRAWSAKEACAKVVGLGLVLPLRDIAVGLGRAGIWNEIGWRTVVLRPGFAGAVALRRQPREDGVQACLR